MRTSLNETQLIEAYLLGELSTADRLLFEANLSLDQGLCERVELQQAAMNQVKAYGRKQLKAQLASIDHQLFTQTRYSRFRQRMLALFKA